ncbi:unnamed protein product [Symbiodinium sp. CCMP2592]|nr:unnamed protein product [Symbiodinium sp. CCMP2592]
MEVDQEEREPPQEIVELDAETFVYEGHEYNTTSSLKILRDLCREFGVVTTGSKKQILKRLSPAAHEREAEHGLLASQKQFEQEVAPLLRPRSEKPDQREVDLHSLTHLRFAPWCEYCVSMRAKENARKKSELVRAPQEEARKSAIASDFCYTATSTSEAPSMVALIACDAWSKRQIVDAGCLPGKDREQDGIHVARSARSLGETYSAKAIENVKVEKPAVVVPSLVDGEERKQLEDALADEAASDPPSDPEQETSHLVPDDTLLSELRREQEVADTEVTEPTAIPLAGREERPDFEEVGSPSKMAKRTVGLVSVFRAENFPDNDEHSDDEAWLGDEEYEAGSEGESDWDLEPSEKQEQPVRVLPQEFFNEEAGLPQVSEEQLEEIDDEAVDKEVTRLTKMQVTEEVDLQRVWQRRARLVAREYNNSKREDIFSPATSPSITKLIPMLALINGWSIWSLGIKDAFLQVPQKRAVKCKVPRGKGSSAVSEKQEKAWRLKRVCLGSEMQVYFGAIFAVIFCNKKVLRGDVSPVLKNLGARVKLQIEGPFLTQDDYNRGWSENTVRFLKRKFCYDSGRLFVRPDGKYVTKLLALLNLGNRKEKASPAPGNVSEVDSSQELPEHEASTYRSCVGILLYIAQDRLDIQFAVRSLSTGMKSPTKKKQRELVHCALYLKKTADYSVCYSPKAAGTSALHRHP